MTHCIDLVEFYITNVCNLNCENCNRFNNFNFSGHYKPEDHFDDYKWWASKINPKTIGILGGEPLLNPHIGEWIDMIRGLWPNSEIHLVTNGTQINKVKNLYNVLKSNKIILSVSLHNNNTDHNIINSVYNFLESPFTETFHQEEWHYKSWRSSYNRIKDESWPECNEIEDFKNLPEKIKNECENIFGFSDKIFREQNFTRKLVDYNGVQAHIKWYNHFHETPLILDSDNEIYFRNSDPEKSIKICDMKNVHTFVDGKLYKCPISRSLYDFVKQFKVNISKKDLKILESYTPADSSFSDTELENFINELKSECSIEMCKFCPESYNNKEIFATKKNKIKLKKL